MQENFILIIYFCTFLGGYTAHGTFTALQSFV